MARTTRTASATTTAVGYIRVSTDKQADHGVSLDAQKAKLEAYATLYELTQRGFTTQTCSKPR